MSLIIFYNLKLYFILNLWHKFIYGNFVDKSVLRTWYADRYLNPIIKFFDYKDIEEWLPNNSAILKKAYLYKKNLLNVLIRK